MNSTHCQAGSNHAADMGFANVTADNLQLAFEPSFEPGGDPPSLDLAYAVYAMSTLHRPGMDTVLLDWENPAGNTEHVWVGLSDFPQNCWQWFSCPESGEISTGVLDTYVNPDHDLYIAVACTGTTTRRLSWISLGERDGRWVTEQISPTGTFYGKPSLRVGSDSHLRMAYTELSLHRLTYGEKQGNNWRTAFIGSAHAEVCDMALGLDDKFHVSYYDRDDKDIWYAECTFTSVSAQAVQSLGDTGLYNSIAVDQAGHPHFAWRSTSNESVNYTWYDGADWHPSVVTLVGDVGGNICLAVNSFGLPRMAYNDWDSGQMVYSWHTGLTWQHNSPDGSDYPGEQGINIALDAAEKTHLVYYANFCNPSELRHNVFDGTDWSMEVIATEPNHFYSCAMAIDEADTIHVAYTSTTDDFSLRYLSNDGGGWVLDPEIIALTTSQLALTTRDNVPYILCCIDDGIISAPFIAYPLE